MPTERLGAGREGHQGEDRERPREWQTCRARVRDRGQWTGMVAETNGTGRGTVGRNKEKKEGQKKISSFVLLFLHTNTHMYIYAYAHTHIYVNAHPHLCTYTCIHIHT